MLILTRCLGERVIIGDNEIIIHVLSQNKQQIKLGITAPADMPVHREEIYKKIRAEGKRVNSIHK